jgi:hypothetical protein
MTLKEAYLQIRKGNITLTYTQMCMYRNNGDTYTRQ